MPVADQGQVVDPGDRRGGLLGGFGVGVHVPADDVRDRGAQVAAGVADGDVGQVERVEDELDAPADQGGVDLVGVAVQRDGRGLGHGAVLGPAGTPRAAGPGTGSQAARRPGTGPAAACPVSEWTRWW